MDVLSQVLSAVRLDGALFFNAEFSAPWCIRSSSSAEHAPLLSPGAGRLIMYHFLTEGRAFAQLPGGVREELQAGDIVVFPQGEANLLGNGSPVIPVDSVRTFGKAVTPEFKVVRHGGGGEITRFVCGYLACDSQLGEIFLAALPPMFKVQVPDEPSGQWLGNSIRYSVEEVSRSDAGSRLVLAKLSELLFVETLRRYINTLPPDQTGWLAGVRDPVVGQALGLLHRSPEHPWTIADLARQVGLSRTRLAERFHHFLAEPPMTYLTRLRLRLGADRLISNDDGVAEVAAAVGYGSEAAFNRAFKREYDLPPAQFRRKHAVSR